MARQADIRVKGLDDLVRDFGKVDRGLRKELQGEIRKVAGIVAGEAKERAVRQGLVDSGKLVRSIRPGVRRSTGVVRVTATRDGFPYPAVYEFGGGGVRAFLMPALKDKTDDVFKGLEDMLDRLTSQAGLR